MDSSKSGKAEGTRVEVKEAHKLLQTLLKPGLPTRKKARFFEYSRSSKTGERILEEHVITKRRYKKKTKPRNRTAETYSSKQRVICSRCYTYIGSTVPVLLYILDKKRENYEMENDSYAFILYLCFLFR
ncbi:uncharacterized protein LOC130625826 [Hydractinia symbiolongicarpus]|uniref:uncharacterized protein LOC130625826 n=1 Tax=Hydractinia symbiolongicarpus TaxID=13093 RepID=UPI002550C101|nr:uncharacterized protein LOC130625826 [Hydractinia symbiolongicarpus]